MNTNWHPLNNKRVVVEKNDDNYNVHIDEKLKYTIQRDLKGLWALRDLKGHTLKRDQYRYDLFEWIATQHPPVVHDFQSTDSQGQESQCTKCGALFRLFGMPCDRCMKDVQVTLLQNEEYVCQECYDGSDEYCSKEGLDCYDKPNR